MLPDPNQSLHLRRLQLHADRLSRVAVCFSIFKLLVVLKRSPLSSLVLERGDVHGHSEHGLSSHDARGDSHSQLTGAIQEHLLYEV